MDILITEKQLKKIIKTKEVKEDDTGPDPQPQAGTSSQQSGGQGYPEVSKWESGVTRGPANQVGVTKWADVVGSSLKRDKANQLKEQGPMGVPSQTEVQAMTNLGQSIGNWFSKTYEEYPVLMPAISSLVAFIATGSYSLWGQLLIQAVIQIPFVAEDIRKEQYFGASLAIALMIIPFATYFKYLKPLLKNLDNGGIDLIKKLKTLQSQDDVLTYINSLDKASSEYRILEKLLQITPNQFSKAIGETIKKDIDNLIKSGQIQIEKMPLKNKIWFKEVVLSMGIFLPSSVAKYLYDKYVMQQFYKDLLPQDKSSIALDNLIDKTDVSVLEYLMINVIGYYETKYFYTNREKYVRIAYGVLMAYRNNPKSSIDYLKQIAMSIDKNIDKNQNWGVVYR